MTEAWNAHSVNPLQETGKTKDSIPLKAEVGFMWRFIKSFFGKVESGEIYEFYGDDNPFSEPPHKVEVIAVKDGWVNYKWLGSKIWQNSSMRIGSFRYCYRRIHATSLKIL